MNEFSDEYLKQKFQASLADYQSEPNSESWEKIAKALPLVDHRPAQRFAIRKMLVYLSLVITLVFFEQKKNDNSEPLATHSDFKPSASVASKQAIANPLTEVVLTDTFNCGQRERTDAVEGRAMQHSVYRVNKYLETKESLLSPYAKWKQYDYLKAQSSSSYTDILKHSSIDSLIVSKIKIDKGLASDSALIVKKEVSELANDNRGWIVKISPFYNTCVFTPNRSDNEQLKNFRQSSNRVGNRLGVAFDIGYRHPVLHELTLEYSLGLRMVSKQFNYQVTSVDSEREINISTVNVSGLASSISLSLTARTMWLSSKWPIMLSISYDRMLASNSVTALMGDQIIYHGIGFERAINSRFVVRPMVSWGVSLSGNSTIAINPVNWGFEAVAKF